MDIAQFPNDAERVKGTIPAEHRLGFTGPSGLQTDRCYARVNGNPSVKPRVEMTTDSQRQ